MENNGENFLEIIARQAKIIEEQQQIINGFLKRVNQLAIDADDFDNCLSQMFTTIDMAKNM